MTKTGYKQTKEHILKNSSKNSHKWVDRIIFTCLYCGKTEEMKPIDAKAKKYCSPKCYFAAGQTDESKEKNRIARTGKNNPNYGKPRMPETIEKIREGNVGKNVGEKSGKWIDGRAWIGSLHRWVERQKGKASEHKCIDCGKQAEEWSNINNHIYRRELDDYVPRCRKCHKKYDKKSTNS